jgi:2-polyprenyl-3-methyl-5-hydroxy-6-metoxy-1,4-benzoquinol methylase
MIWALSLILLANVALLSHFVAAETKSQHYNISQEQWEKEYSKGQWEYLDRVAIERARNAIIVNMFYSVYGGGAYGSLRAGNPRYQGSDSSKSNEVDLILDVGCGLGTLSDYLHGPQRDAYLGLDLSNKAVEKARKVRSTPSPDGHGQPLKESQFKQSDAMSFTPPPGVKYGTIVFNEMLYYVDHVKVMQHYSQFLKPDGIMVVSVWFNHKYKELRDTIFADANRLFKSVDSAEMDGVTYTGTSDKTGRMKVSFHVEGFQMRGK